MPEDNKGIPLGVWVFWSLAGLGLLIALFRWATGGNPPAYIAPVAACISALAATAAVYMATRTFAHTRQDRLDEIESKHPRFVISYCSVLWITQQGGNHDITPFHEVFIELKNIRESSAKHVYLRGEIIDKEGKVLREFSRQPTDYIEKDGVFKATTKAAGVWDSPDPYYVKLYLTYRDARTGRKHPQTLWRKFYMQGEEGQELELLSVDNAEIKGITETLEIEGPAGSLK
jgi:hypothetical protein